MGSSGESSSSHDGRHLAASIPKEFLDALNREFEEVGFYRRSARAKILLSYGNHNSIQIRVEITAELVATKQGSIDVLYPNITKPKGLEVGEVSTGLGE
jgi:hypothetical protein